jgi:hypothetical protein
MPGTISENPPPGSRPIAKEIAWPVILNFDDDMPGRRPQGDSITGAHKLALDK